jgi:hypothetical protein
MLVVHKSKTRRRCSGHLKKASNIERIVALNQTAISPLVAGPTGGLETRTYLWVAGDDADLS